MLDGMGDSNPADELSASPESQKEQTPETFGQTISGVGPHVSPEYLPTLDESRAAGY